jgi:hypothetical protein
MGAATVSVVVAVGVAVVMMIVRISVAVFRRVTRAGVRRVIMRREQKHMHVEDLRDVRAEPHGRECRQDAERRPSKTSARHDETIPHRTGKGNIFLAQGDSGA